VGGKKGTALLPSEEKKGGELISSQRGVPSTKRALSYFPFWNRRKKGTGVVHRPPWEKVSGGGEDEHLFLREKFIGWSGGVEKKKKKRSGVDLNQCGKGEEGGERRILYSATTERRVIQGWPVPSGKGGAVLVSGRCGRKKGPRKTGVPLHGHQ